MIKIIKDMKDQVAGLLGKSKPETPYYIMGGEAVLQKLVDRFYYHMDTDPNAKRCRDLHGESLSSANKKLFMFLSGWLGGPSLYIEAYGHPRMRMRHMPFIITQNEVDEWLLCMRNALNDLELEMQLDQQLWHGIRKFANHMKNS